MSENSGLKTLRFIFLTVVLFVLSFSAVVVTILNVYVPKYLATVDGEEIGYFTSPAEFDDIYEKLVEEKKADGLEVEVYLAENPEFELSYVRDAAVEEQNLYTNLREVIKADYTIYNVKVAGKKEMTFATKKEADDYAAKLKKSIKSTIKVQVEEETTQDVVKTTDTASAKKIYNNLVSRYKPYVRKTYKTTQSGYISSGSGTYCIGKPKGDIYNFIKGGRRPCTGVVTQGYGGKNYQLYRSSYRHSGIDIATNDAPPIYPYKSGTVITVVNSNSGYGCYVMVDHGTSSDGTRLITQYAHMKYGSIKVKVGDKVSTSTVLGKMGSTGRSTGIHLHFEIRTIKNGKTTYYDPAYFI